MATPRHMLRSRRVALWALWAVAASLLQIAAATTSTTPAASTLSKNMKKGPWPSWLGAGRGLIKDDDELHGILQAPLGALRAIAAELRDSSTFSWIKLLVPCLREQIGSVGISLFSILAETMTCLVDSNYQERPTLVCMLEGPAKKHLLALVEVVLDTIKCIAKNTVPDASQGDRGSCSSCHEAGVRAQVLAEGLAAHTAKVCEVFNRELLERVDPNEMADGVARFVFCSSHHYKGLVSGVTPFLVEWSSCTNRHPTDSTEGHIACFLRSTNIISFGINLGQQINNFMGCLLSSNSSSVLCSKKVQKVEDCSNMCPDSRYPNMEAASISSPALSVTVRKDDCKLSPRLASNATLSSLNASLDYSMKLIQCFPIHFGDTYQQMMNHVKVINQCTASRAENWGAWAQCLYDEHDVKLVAPYFVKVRLTIACIVGGDVPAQTFCVRSMKSAEDCRSCGGQDSANILDPVSALGATNTCSV